MSVATEPLLARCSILSCLHHGTNSLFPRLSSGLVYQNIVICVVDNEFFFWLLVSGFRDMRGLRRSSYIIVIESNFVVTVCAGRSILLEQFRQCISCWMFMWCCNLTILLCLSMCAVQWSGNKKYPMVRVLSGTVGYKIFLKNRIQLNFWSIGYCRVLECFGKQFQDYILRLSGTVGYWNFSKKGIHR